MTDQPDAIDRALVTLALAQRRDIPWTEEERQRLRAWFLVTQTEIRNHAAQVRAERRRKKDRERKRAQRSADRPGRRNAS